MSLLLGARAGRHVVTLTDGISLHQSKENSKLKVEAKDLVKIFFEATAFRDRYEKAFANFNGDLARKVTAFNKKYQDRVKVIPVAPGMVELVKRFQAGKLPGVDTLAVSPREKGKAGLYRDHIHPTSVVMALQGYVYYATIYGEDPTALSGFSLYPGNPELDKILREVARDQVMNHL